MCSTIAIALLAIVAQAHAQDSPANEALSLRRLQRDDSQPIRNQDHTLLVKAKHSIDMQSQEFAEGSSGRPSLPWATACGKCACQEQVCKWNTFTACCQFCCDGSNREGDASLPGMAALTAETAAAPAVAALIGLAAGSGITFLAVLMFRNHRGTTPAGYQPLMSG